MPLHTVLPHGKAGGDQRLVSITPLPIPRPQRDLCPVKLLVTWTPPATQTWAEGWIFSHSGCPARSDRGRASLCWDTRSTKHTRCLQKTKMLPLLLSFPPAHRQLSTEQQHCTGFPATKQAAPAVPPSSYLSFASTIAGLLGSRWLAEARFLPYKGAEDFLQGVLEDFCSAWHSPSHTQRNKSMKR